MGTAVAVGTTALGGLMGRQARERAAEQQVAAAEGNIRFLKEQGALAQGDINRSLLQAIGGETERRLGPLRGRETIREPGVLDPAIARATEALQPFATTGTDAFTTARGNILAGGGDSAASEAISEAGKRAALARFGNLGNVVRGGIQERASLAGQAATPALNRQLLGVGQTGLSAVGDIGGLNIRRAELAGDITRQAGAAGASALIGQAPQIANLMQTGQEARLLGRLGQQRANIQGAEQIAALIGRGT